MKEQETNKILAIIVEAYPSFRKDRNPVITSQLWHETLGGKHYVDVQDALLRYIAEDTRGFPPTPGALLEIVSKMEGNDDVPALLPLCRLACRAIRHGPEHAEEGFRALPSGVRRIIGSAENLKALASLDKPQQTKAIAKLTKRLADDYLQGGTSALLEE